MTPTTQPELQCASKVHKMREVIYDYNPIWRFFILKLNWRGSSRGVIAASFRPPSSHWAVTITIPCLWQSEELICGRVRVRRRALLLRYLLRHIRYLVYLLSPISSNYSFGLLSSPIAHSSEVTWGVKRTSWSGVQGNSNMGYARA